MMTKQEDLIPLQASHVTQGTSGHIKTAWSVQLNGTEDKILELPSTYSEDEIFHIMDFAKKYELEAFNIGINFAKRQGNAYMKDITDKQLNIIKALKSDNDRLASALEKEMFKNIIEE